jgi:hypothetical protein
MINCTRQLLFYADRFFLLESIYCNRDPAAFMFWQGAFIYDLRLTEKGGRVARNIAATTALPFYGT